MVLVLRNLKDKKNKILWSLLVWIKSLSYNGYNHIEVAKTSRFVPVKLTGNSYIYDSNFYITIPTS